VVLLRHLLANREQIAMVTLHKYNMSNSTSADEGGFLANELKHVRWLRARMVSALELLSHSRRG
jgi:hypothetical protein